MGYHYVSRMYLREFCDPATPGRVWAYDRMQKKVFCTSIDNIAQENKYYSDSDEKALSEHVEGPAAVPLDKLRSGHPISDDERAVVAQFMIVQLHRVPYHRQKKIELAPTVLHDTIQNTISVVRRRAEEAGLPADMIQDQLDEVDRIRAKHEGNPAGFVEDFIRSPWPFSRRLIDGIQLMTWRVLTASGPSYFLTSDNPFFFFENMGIGRVGAEIGFPLSSKAFLLGTWQIGEDCQRWPASEKLVKEMNRRTASRSTRFLYHCCSADWVRKLGDRMDYRHDLTIGLFSRRIGVRGDLSPLFI